MQQGSDYAAPYYPHQHIPTFPNPSEFPAKPADAAPSLASAPPYSHHPDRPSDYAASSYSAAPYPPYPRNPDPVASSYAPPTPAQPQQNPPPSFQPYGAPLPPAFPPEQSPPDVSTYPHLQQQQPPPVPYYPSYDSPQNIGNYPHSAPQSSGGYSSYEIPYESSLGRVDRTGSGGGGAYAIDSYGGYTSNPDTGYPHSVGSYEQDYYGKKPEISSHYGQPRLHDDVFGEGVYQYDGGRSEPYGARGTKSASSFSVFDDYGRSTNSSSSMKESLGGSKKIVKAVPKMETQEDANSGVQKFRVKLLSESSGQSTTDVLCQIGLDGIRMLDPSTNRMLRIYPLDNVTRWEAKDSIYTFWAKSSVDIEPRRIRLQSNSYTTNTILDTIAAATVQLKEMGGKDVLERSSSNTSNPSEQPTEKKKGIVDWVNLIKPANEEKDHWVPDEVVSRCTSCGNDFGAFVRKHHCRNCGDIFCDKCTSGRIALTADEQAQAVRVCDRCMAEVTQRLSVAKERANKPVSLVSHEDLAKKLQEEMDKKLRVSGGNNSSNGSGKRMREVACPTCTVHLQVNVPSSGSETIECGVCQNPFLVSSH